MQMTPGRWIDRRYEILEKIGSGGMSVVYKAHDHKLDRPVALKILKEDYYEDEAYLKKFRIEAQAAAKLEHPNVVGVYDVNEADGLHYIVMEYIDGMSLKEYIEKAGPLPYQDAVKIAIHIGRGLEAAHQSNIIHRDVKPQNVMLSRNGKIKVTDFGIARTLTANTISQEVFGSVHYLSPEQAMGKNADERSDIYSFGIMLFEMITGHVPFHGESNVSVALQHVQEDVPLLSDCIPDIPLSIDMVVEKCTERKPNYRYQKMSSLLADLEQVLKDPDRPVAKLGYETEKNATIILNGEDARVLQTAEQGRSHPSRDLSEAYAEETEEEEDWEEEPKRSKKPVGNRTRKTALIVSIISGVLLIVLLLVLFVIEPTRITSGCAGKSKEQTQELVTMPDVKNLKYQEATDRLTALGLSVVIRYQDDEKVEPDCVISQSIQGNKQIAKGETVTLTVSSGIGKVVVGDYIGRTQNDAQAGLKKDGLQVRISQVYDASVETGRVISMSPAPGTEVAKNTVVELSVSRGKEVVNVTVPQLIGSRETDAVRMLTELGLTYAVTYQEIDGQDGIVLNQSYASGSHVETGTIIQLTVGRQPETRPAEPETPERITVPYVTGMTGDEAIQLLQGMGLNYSISFQKTDMSQNEMVLTQTPNSDTLVNAGATVYLTIGEGQEEPVTDPQPEP